MRVVRPLWRVAAFVLIGCRGGAHEDSTPAADTHVNERLVRLETSVISLQVTVDAQARQLHCAEVQRAMRAAWYEHERTVRAFAATSCDEVGGVCADTGLPPRTFERYGFSISRVVGEADDPIDTLRGRMDDVPKLPQPPVRGDWYASMGGTRAAAESATKYYLAECDPAGGSPGPT